MKSLTLLAVSALMLAGPLSLDVQAGKIKLQGTYSESDLKAKCAASGGDFIGGSASGRYN